MKAPSTTGVVHRPGDFDPTLGFRPHRLTANTAFSHLRLPSLLAMELRHRSTPRSECLRITTVSHQSGGGTSCRPFEAPCSLHRLLHTRAPAPTHFLASPTFPHSSFVTTRSFVQRALLACTNRWSAAPPQPETRNPHRTRAHIPGDTFPCVRVRPQIWSSAAPSCLRTLSALIAAPSVGLHPAHVREVRGTGAVEDLRGEAPRTTAGPLVARPFILRYALSVARTWIAACASSRSSAGMRPPRARRQHEPYPNHGSGFTAPRRVGAPVRWRLRGYDVRR
ncbi:hypothetical protein B0H17DRAFT_1339606 [Mycena rosella]|uniref:Uncharacterized protein n=1 Tax=Mycena rosella TaxID=1033263 RepID=A0AAD7C0X1_MYCRO|nr:hypothetical protein B0H17DRAFT_1339606 [Mycena rosella]